MIEPAQLADAVWAGDLSAVEAMLAAGADPNASAPERMSPLHLAIEQQRIAIVRRLIAAGANIHEVAGDGWSPLAHAIDIESDAAWQAHHEPGHESTELTALLLAAGAQPTEQAFAAARAYHNQQALALLERAVQAGAGCEQDGET